MLSLNVGQSRSFFDVNEHYCPLETIGFRTDLLYRKQFEAILPFLRSRSEPCKLSLDSGCVPLLLRALETGVRVGSLKISGPNVRDEDVERLLSGEHSRRLVELEIHTGELSSGGYAALARFLGREGTSVRRVDLGRIRIDAECARTVLSSIPSRSTLQELELGGLYQHGDERSYAAAVRLLTDLVCDRSSFAALCGSNHELRSVGRDPGARVTRSDVLREALEINGRRGRSINQRRRSKLRAFYFRGEFELRPFVGMEAALLPGVLELVTMSEERIAVATEGRAARGAYVTARNGHLGGVYRLVRNCRLPELFGFPSPQSQMERLEAKNAELERTVGSLMRKIDWLNEKLLYMCLSPGQYRPKKRLKRKAESHLILESS